MRSAKKKKKKRSQHSKDYLLAMRRKTKPDQNASPRVLLHISQDDMLRSNFNPIAQQGVPVLRRSSLYSSDESSVR